MRCAEFFSGIGGMHYALGDACPEAKVIAAFDINKIANETYEHNFGLKPISRNIEHLGLQDFERLRADCWLMSPPCQPFTQGGKMLDDQDPRSKGLFHLLNLLKEMQYPPKFIFLENVPNFEMSNSHQYLIATLQRLGYSFEEYLISPCDPWINLPNNRMRYYLAASKLAQSQQQATTELIKRFTDVLGSPSPLMTCKISAFLDENCTDTSTFSVPESYIISSKTYRHGMLACILCMRLKFIDIVNGESVRSATFTKSYGSKHFIGTGSLLQTRRLDIDLVPDDKELLLTLGLRFFSPNEIARLHGFPVDGDDIPSNQPSLQFPKHVSTAQQYRLLGNSLNVKVVTLILRRLFTK